MDLGIDGNAAFLSAASAGLGLASAEAFAEEGVDVAICGRTRERLEEAEQRLQQAGSGDVLAIQADNTDREATEAAIAETVETFGRLDHLVTSAGGPPMLSLMETTDEDWYDAFDQLLMSAVWAIKAAHPHLTADGGGTIVTITSGADEEVIEGHVFSNAVRRGVGGLMKTVSVEFAPDVRANAVLPGPHETARIRDFADSAVEQGASESTDAFLDAMGDDIPLSRIGDPRELGDTVAWLSSERASFINGRALLLDGGSVRSF